MGPAFYANGFKTWAFMKTGPPKGRFFVYSNIFLPSCRNPLSFRCPGMLYWNQAVLQGCAEGGGIQDQPLV